LDDPSLRLVKVEVERADLWDAPGVLVRLVGFVKSAVNAQAAWPQSNAAM
jgi:hypothetical protein